MEKFYEKVIQAVHRTRKFIVNPELYRSVDMKGEADFVTAADYAVSSFLEEELHKLAPSVGFMSEEEKPHELPPTRWILDPVDGTTNLVYGYRMSSVSLALLEEGKIRFGVVYNPYTRETFYAIRGKGAFSGGTRLQVNDRLPHDGLVEFGAGSTRKGEADEVFELGKDIFKNVLDLRRICSSALSLSFIGAGRLNGYFEKTLKPWDYAAASLIIEEAGGRLCDWYGKPVQFDVPGGIIAGSPKMFEFLKARILK